MTGVAKAVAPGTVAITATDSSNHVSGVGKLTVLARPVTLTFDDLPARSTLSSQYQRFGVFFSSVLVDTPANLLGNARDWPAQSGANAIGIAGTASVTFDPAITGPIQTVSAYVSGGGDTARNNYIRAFDANSNVVGEAFWVKDSPPNTLLTVISTDSAITRVEFSSQTGVIAVDDLSFY